MCIVVSDTIAALHDLLACIGCPISFYSVGARAARELSRGTLVCGVGVTCRGRLTLVNMCTQPTSQSLLQSWLSSGECAVDLLCGADVGPQMTLRGNQPCSNEQVRLTSCNRLYEAMNTRDGAYACDIRRSCYRGRKCPRTRARTNLSLQRTMIQCLQFSAYSGTFIVYMESRGPYHAPCQSESPDKMTDRVMVID